MKKIAIGMIGLDTSHAVSFTKLLNDERAEFHVPGGKVTVAFPGGSPDFPRSIERVRPFADQLVREYGVALVDSPEHVAERCDAILLTSVDGRVHAEQLRSIVRYGKPVFVDKPFALSTAEAEAMVRLAGQEGVALMSSSALRYARKLREALDVDGGEGDVIGADLCGPLKWEPTQPGYFWYGIHAIEMMYAAMGRGCAEVRATCTDRHDVLVGRWRDGRIATVRGSASAAYGAVVHRERGSRAVQVDAREEPYYVGLLREVIRMFHTGQSPLDEQETLELIRFVEAANESRETGKTVAL